jgi:hypothetical protein
MLGEYVSHLSNFLHPHFLYSGKSTATLYTRTISGWRISVDIISVGHNNCVVKCGINVTNTLKLKDHVTQ